VLCNDTAVNVPKAGKALCTAPSITNLGKRMERSSSWYLGGEKKKSSAACKVIAIENISLLYAFKSSIQNFS